MEEKKLNELTANDVLETIKTKNVELSREDYAKEMDKAFTNTKKGNGEKPLTEAEKHKRIQSNFAGTVINFLLPIYQIVNEMIPIIYAIAEKTGVEFERIETEEDKAMKAVQEVMQAKKVEMENQNKKLGVKGNGGRS